MAGYKIVIRRDLESGATTWEPGCPLLVEAAQVSRDTDTGKAFLQARVRNVSAERITGYTVRFDVGYEGHEPEGLRASKLDADLAPGASVALKPISLAHGDADSLEFAVESAKTSDGTWKSTSGPEPIPSTKLEGLSGGALDERNKLIDAMRLKNPDRAKASAIVEGDDWWVCICGTPNVGTKKCSVCSLRKETGKQLCCEESLQKLAAKRLRDQEAEAAKQSRNKKIAVVGIVVGLFALTAVAAIVAIRVVIPGAQYDQATTLFEEGQQQEALAIFEQIPDYKNAQEWIDACKNSIDYDQAVEFYNAGQYEQALEIFESLGDYQQSEELADQCKVKAYLASRSN